MEKNEMMEKVKSVKIWDEKLMIASRSYNSVTVVIDAWSCHND